jgi:hypothetical protein
MNVATLAVLTIVLIADSHSDYYGIPKGEDFGFFGRKLTELFPHMALYAVSGSRPRSWLQNQATPFGCTIFVDGKLSGGKNAAVPRAQELPKAELLVIEQGTNMADHSDPGIEDEIKNLISAVQGKYTSLLWIGPPPARPNKISHLELMELDAKIRKCVLPFGSYYSSLSSAPDEGKGGKVGGRCRQGNETPG